MRITTKMLNQSTLKAGLPLDGLSLLDYINKDNSAASVLAEKNNILETVGNAVKSKEYRKLWTAAESLDAQAKKFAAEGEENIFAKIKDGDTSAICKEAEQLAEGYNEVMSLLKKNPDGMNPVYLKALKSFADDNKEALESVGISVGKDGLLSVDKDKLAAADAEALKRVFGAESSFVPGVSFIASKASDNARAEAESISSLYGANGNQISGSGYGKYDFWG